LVDIEDKDVEEISLNLEVSTFNEVYKKISEILKQIDKSLTKNFHEEFYKMLREEISNINQSVENTIPNYIYASKVLGSKIKIYKYFFDTLTEKAQPFNSDSESFALLKDLNEKLKINSDLMCDVMYKLYPKINERTENLKKQLEEALKGAQVVDEEIKTFEEKIILSNKERDFVISQSREEKESLLIRIETLESENKIMTEKLLQNAKMLINENDKQYLDYNNLNLSENKYNSKQGGIIQPRKLEELNSNLKNSSGSGGGFGKFGGNDKEKNFSSQQVIVTSRVLTVKMLKEMIDDIYNSKLDYDVKCKEYKMPRETMEQHMYSFLNQKYGLKVNFYYC